MTPQFSQGVFSQKAWPGKGPGPLDDCWICADLMAVHGCAPWSVMWGIPNYRRAAGVPDTAKGSEGGTLEASQKAMKALYPGLAVTLYRGPWAEFIAEVEKGRCFSGSVLSGALPSALRFGFTGSESRHRIAGYWNGTELKVANPLAAPHSKPVVISEAALRKAFSDYPKAAEAAALLMPTVEEAFLSHPLYVAPVPTPAVQLAPGIYKV